MDGTIRLYDRKLTVLKKTKAPGGDRPYDLDFAPDGRTLAEVVYLTTNVDLLSGSTLARVGKVETGFANNGDLVAVRWSANGASPHGRWRSLTFIAALRHDGITAPLVFDGPINGENATDLDGRHISLLFSQPLGGRLTLGERDREVNRQTYPAVRSRQGHRRGSPSSFGGTRGSGASDTWSRGGGGCGSR